MLVLHRVSYADNTWINPKIIRSYSELHQQGVAHSIETWNEQGQLVGGLYGLNLGQLFFGESMFSTETDASKVAFAYLMHICAGWNMTASSGLKFFSTPPHHCSYLDEQEATTLFADPEAPMNTSSIINYLIMALDVAVIIFISPNARCNACISVRIPVALFKQSRQQRRVWKNNLDVTVRKVNAHYVQAHYELYAEYIQQRHADGDMHPPSIAQYVSFYFLTGAIHGSTSFTHDGKLLAVSVCDALKNGVSAVYTFYDCQSKKVVA
jgi:arginyl-tRNA--protein-N-Asp/Glu arginylyltransferase